MTKIFYIDNSVEISLTEKVQRILSAAGGLSEFVNPGSLVLIKPNFVAPFSHATTSLRVLETIVKKIHHCNGNPVLAESSGFEFDTETTFRILGIYDFAKRYNVRVVNLDNEKFIKVKSTSKLIGELEISELAVKADVIINVPKLKRHNLTRVTVGVKNLFGFLSRETRKKIHAVNLEKGIYEVARIINPDLTIVDGSVVTTRAVYGEHKRLDTIVGGTNPFAVDIFCCRLLGDDFNQIYHIRKAIGNGLDKDEMVFINAMNGSKEFLPALGVAGQLEHYRNRTRKCLYQFLYFIDILYSKIFNGKSIIPLAHYYFGLRPHLERSKCTECGDCVPICPVDAIRIPEKKIDRNLCMSVRCMKCIEACNESAIMQKNGLL